MEKIFSRKTVLSLILGLTIVLAGWSQGLATVPGKISYQGQLTDTVGNPLDGDYFMTFLLYPTDSSVSSSWNSPVGIPVTVENGIFNVMLGANNPLNPALFNSGQAWLEIVVDGEILSPRQQVTTTAYALKAGDADTLEGSSADSFALADHDHDTAYINVNEGNAVSSGMIQIGAVNSSVVADNSLTATDLAPDSVGSSELAPNSVGSLEVIDNSLTSADLAANSVTASEIDWTINHTGTDLNGGLLHLTNSSDATVGNFPMGVSGQATGNPTDNPVIGVFGGSPGLGLGAPTGSLPDRKIGVAGASDTGHGVVGVSTSGFGVYAYTGGSSGRAVFGHADNTGNYYNYGGYFQADGTYGKGVYGKATGESAYGIYGYSINGDGIFGSTGSSNEHAGYFTNSYSVGLSGAALYARASNSTADGIALWAHNSHTASTDATAVLSNDGSGPLLKGFGGDGGNEEIRIDNNGSIHVYDSSIADDVFYFNAANGYLYIGSGNSLTPGDDGDLVILDSDGSQTIILDGNTGRTTTRSLRITGGSDLSEQFDVKPVDIEVVPGMVVSIDPENPGDLQVSTTAYDNKVAGIISGANGIKTGMMMGQDGTEADGKHPVALTGRVYCKADASQGSIQPGDLLTTSSVPGHAMKVTDHSKANGAILGKAMTSLGDGQGMVLVLVSLQ